MKIMNRKDFLKMPKNTVYSKYAPCVFSEFSIKDETCGNDFFTIEIQDAIAHNSSSEFSALLEGSANNRDLSLEMDFYFIGRDGRYEEEMWFAVWEKEDIERLIARLQECIMLSLWQTL